MFDLSDQFSSIRVAATTSPVRSAGASGTTMGGSFFIQPCWPWINTGISRIATASANLTRMGYMGFLVQDRRIGMPGYRCAEMSIQPDIAGKVVGAVGVAKARGVVCPASHGHFQRLWNRITHLSTLCEDCCTIYVRMARVLAEGESRSASVQAVTDHTRQVWVRADASEPGHDRRRLFQTLLDPLFQAMEPSAIRLRRLCDRDPRSRLVELPERKGVFLLNIDGRQPWR